MDTTTGYATDYVVHNETTPPESTGHFDSTDAYAGTFLAAAWSNYVAYPDLGRLQQLMPYIRLGVKAIESTQQSDGLTWAARPPTTPSTTRRPVAGSLVRGIALAIGDQEQAAQVLNDSQRVGAGIAYGMT